LAGFEDLFGGGDLDLDDVRFLITIASVPVPGPVAGAGLPALLGLGGFVWARRRKAAAAV
jgi:LPXTG-motif cell wall-anchored protein